MATLHPHRRQYGDPATPLPIELGRMRRRHVPQVIDIERRVYPRPWTMTLFLWEIGQRSTRFYIVARSGRRVVGYAGLMVFGDEAHVTNIAVDPDVHRRKVASRLLFALVSEARRRGATACTLEVRVANHAAQNLYHQFAHVYANVLEHGPLPLPAVVFVVSGGHTSLLVMDEKESFRVLGQTIDDAAGEAYDKVARVLGLGYPGGPALDRLARDGDPEAVRSPRPLRDDAPDDFSLWGLKTAVLRHVRDHPDTPVHDVAAAFQEAVVDVQVSKVLGAARREGLDTVLLAGGGGGQPRPRARPG